MALGFRFCYSIYGNLLGINFSNYELANTSPKAFTKINNSLISLFHTFTLRFTPNIFFMLSFAPIINIYIDKNIQKTIKYTLKSLF